MSLVPILILQNNDEKRIQRSKTSEYINKLNAVMHQMYIILDYTYKTVKM